MKDFIFKAKHLVSGANAEHLASQYLKKQGMMLVTQNFSAKTGEIDLIMKDNDVLVFIEVRFRKDMAFGLAQETVDIKKQKKIVKTAKLYLVNEKLVDQCACRFDIVAIHGTIPDHQITWIANAFDAR